MGALLQDLRFAARTLRKHPGFTTLATITLAIGIGASTTIFTLVNTVLLRPLEYRAPHELVTLKEIRPDRPRTGVTSPANVTLWERQASSFSSVAATYDQPRNITSPGEADEILTRLTTSNFFSTLGAQAHVGRAYGAHDDPAAVVVISHALWQRRFGGDPAAVGRTITVNDQVRTVVGVMPAEFRSVGVRPDAWIPMRLDPNWGGRYLTVTARLRQGVTVQQAEAEVIGIAKRRAEAHERYRPWTASVTPLQDDVTVGVRPALVVLLGAVGLLLLIACANVANLLLGRAAARRTEIAVRLSLGATRARIVRQVLTESLLLAFVAGVAGVLLAVWGTEAVVRLVPGDLALPRADEVRVDGAVLAFAVFVCGLTGVLFGTVPAVLGSAVNPAVDTREGVRGTTGARSATRTTLVVGEVALAVVLLVGAGLLGRSLQQLLHVDTGLRTDQVLTMRMMLSAARYEDEAELRTFVDRVLTRVREVPGVAAAGGEMYLALSGLKIGHSFTRDDRPRPRPGEELSTDIRVVAGDYFRALGIPLLRGRTFEARDDQRAPNVFVINQELARRYFPDRDPVGQRVSFEWDGRVSGEIVGIVGSVREMGPRDDPSPAIYRPYVQMPMPQLSLVIRAGGDDPLALAPAIAAAIRQIDPNQPVADVRPMQHVAADTLARPRSILYALGGFASAALLLAALGLYGVVSYSVTQRRQEIGVRVALGAQRNDVLRPIIAQGMRLTAAGLVLGLAGALATGRVLQTFLFGVQPADPVTFAAVALFLGAVALLATYVPARRATRLDPVTALRIE